MRNQKEIEDQLAEADSIVETGSTKVRSMTYEEGVQAALLWVLEQQEAKPMDD